MKYCALILLLALSGCAAPKIDLDAKKMKSQQKQRVKASNQQLQDQTGDKAELTKRKTKFGLPTAPTD